MAQAAIGISSKPSSQAAPRRQRHWPNRTQGLSPDAAQTPEPNREAPLAAGTLTARQLIAMARAARADRER